MTIEEFNDKLAKDTFDKVCLVLTGVHLHPIQALSIHKIIDAHPWPPPERK